MSRESIYGDEPEFTVLKMVEGKETWISLAQLAAELEAGDNGAKPPGYRRGLSTVVPCIDIFLSNCNFQNGVLFLKSILRRAWEEFSLGVGHFPDLDATSQHVSLGISHAIGAWTVSISSISLQNN
jgi:hypothetical protein